MNSSPLNELNQLYSEFPELACTCCGMCCVSPTCTLVEFVNILRYSKGHFGPDEMAEFIHAQPAVHLDYEGNLRCALQKKLQCSVHPGRTAACRLFGIPALKELHITELEECKNNITTISGNATVTLIQDWLIRIMKINSSIYDPECSPYFLRGLNLECWLDIYFDATLDFDVFSDIRAFMHQMVDLKEYAQAYRPKTAIREKIDKISILSAMIGACPASDLKELLLSIRDGYPFTGTFFYDEANAYLEKINS